MKWFGLRVRGVVTPFMMAVLVSSSAVLHAQEASGWPREIETPKGLVTVYQPQPEWFEGNKLASRCAVSVTPTDTGKPLFGVMWTTARVETDRDADVVYILGVQVTDVRFPEASETQLAEFRSLIEREVPTWELDVSYEQLVSSLAVMDLESESAKDLKTAPPRILFSTEPAVLVIYDGDPQLRDIEDTKYQRVVNTAQAVVFDPAKKTYYLSGGAVWYQAGDAKGPWQQIQKPPAGVAALVPVSEDERAAAENEPVSTAAPRIIVSTEPAELIVAVGEPTWTPIRGTNLLFMSNSESDVLMDIESQRTFVLISGRWYQAESMVGPWTFVASDALPEDFAAIPYESANGHLLMYVAGTDQAREAVMDAQLPQTSTVSRESPDLNVTYDGDPRFESIEKTEMEYAINSAFSVIHSGGHYYCCHEAVWYESGSPNGPWTVAVKIPAEFQTIPPSCPVYNVKYVYVYDYTPTVVHVGYTSGYMGGYVYGPCVVYGTGWYYPPYWGPHYYYPRPATYGFHARYNPYYGWGFGVSYSRGPFRITHVGAGYPHGYWGPRRYRPYPYRSYTKTHINVNRNINIHTGDINVGRRPGRSGVYERPENRRRNVDRPQTTDRKKPRASERKNDVYADRNGNVHRRTDQGWESRAKGSWKREPGGSAEARPSRPSTGKKPQARPSTDKKPQAKPSQSRPSRKPEAKKPGSSSRKQLNRDHQARQRGAQKGRSGDSRGGGRRR